MSQRGHGWRIAAWLTACCLTAIATRTRAAESITELKFDKRSYSFAQSLTAMPHCPTLLDKLYSMDTMRALTRFIDSIDMLDEQPHAQVVKVSFSLLGMRGALVYNRSIDPQAGRVRIALRSYRNNIQTMPYPTSFLAKYHVTHRDGFSQVLYTQRATTSKDISVFYRLFVKRQMKRFAGKLQKIVEEHCQ